MGKKSWMTYPERQASVAPGGVVNSVRCRLNRGMGCTCGTWSSVKIFTKEEREIARRFDVKKELEDALEERRKAGLSTSTS